MAIRLEGFVREGSARGTGAHGGRQPAPVWTGREVCGNPACPGGWLAFLKDRRRPVFEGRWGCTARCLESMVRPAVRRESGERSSEKYAGQHRHGMPLGLILLAQGWITHPQLQHALDRQRRAGNGRIGRWLTEECGLDQSCITRGLGVQWGCPVLTMEGFDPERMALAAPRLLVEQTGMLPLRIAENRTLYLGFVDRPDAPAALALERMSALKVESGLVDAGEWRAAQQRLCACDCVDAAFEQVVDMESLAGRVASVVNRMQPRASRLVRVHQLYWLRMWLEEGAMGTRDGGVPRAKQDVVDRLYAVGSEQ